MKKHVRLALAAVPLALLPKAANAQAYLGLYATEPRYASPNSMQFQAVSTALDLSTIQDSEFDNTLPEGDADTIGAAFTYFDAGDQHGERYEGRYQRARRMGEGTRMRFLIDLPIAVAHADKLRAFGIVVNNGTAVYGTLSAGVELPASRNWFLTPRIAYSNLQAGQNFFYDGEQLTASMTSRAKIAQVGRGDLVLGNMVAYTQLLDTGLSRQPGFVSDGFFTLRNGVAYQFPLQKRMFGRQTSIRGSYVFTYTGVQGAAFKQIHEVGVNVGVRSREVEQKNRFEQMRIGLLYTHGKNEYASDAGYDAATLTLGYRF